MHYFLDTEFNERGPDFPIDLISIALVNKTGEYYAQNRAHRGNYVAVMNGATQLPGVDPWLIENVYKQLINVDSLWRTRAEMRQDLIDFITETRDSNPMEVWGYFADYDWVLLSQTFGRMIDVQNYISDMPMHCKDLKQTMGDLGVKRRDLDHIKVPTQIWVWEDAQNGALHPLDDHNCLYDAYWNMYVYDYLQEVKEQQENERYGQTTTCCR
jgi:hypothetical protein